MYLSVGIPGRVDAAPGAGPAAGAALDAELFPLPKPLEPNVRFWTRVYAEHPSDHVLLHDEWHLDVVYAVVDFSALEKSGLSAARREAIRRREVDRIRDKYETVLKHLGAGRRDSRLAEEEARVIELFADVPGGQRKYLEAIPRLRTQTCLRDRFAEGIERSGAYLPGFEETFRRHGLPLELTRLPFVESLFQTRARSKAAAAGVWQFVASTARPYLQMSWEVDERFDPFRAADAAARLLKEHHRVLGSWPLAITAYNHGRNGVRRALATVGSRDLGEISSRYRSRLFGFASRNFYAEFYAAATVYAERATTFPEVAPRPPLRFDEWTAGSYVSLRHLAKEAGLELDLLEELNPAVSSEVWKGHLFLPTGYSLRVPEGRREAVAEAFSRLGPAGASTHQRGLRYRVRRGDTLAAIASRFGTQVRSLQVANNLRSPHRIRVGQLLLIPSAARPLVATGGTYEVRRGDTLSGIARRHGASLASVLAANGLAADDTIRVGQRIHIPGGQPKTHTVRLGDTLAGIARLYGTTVAALQAANRITSHIIRPSQILVIP